MRHRALIAVGSLVAAGLTIGAMAMNNASDALQIVSNNIANINTPGFKASRAVQSNAFSSLLPGGSPGVSRHRPSTSNTQP